MVLIANDDLIARLLNRNKLTAGHGKRWTRERVTSLRSHHKIPVHRAPGNGIGPWLNLTKAAAYLGISANTLRIAAESAEIECPPPADPLYVQPLPLDGTAAQALVERVRQVAKHARGDHSRSDKFFLFNRIDRRVL